MLGAIAISFIALAFCNNNTFTDIAAKEYRLVKETIAEKLNYSYPDSIAIIMPEENFLVTHNIVSNVVTDEIGKLSTSVDWAAKTLPLQLIYELTNDKAKAKKIKMNVYKRAQLPLDSILQKDGWLLDIEKIYLTK